MIGYRKMMNAVVCYKRMCVEQYATFCRKNDSTPGTIAAQTAFFSVRIKIEHPKILGIHILYDYQTIGAYSIFTITKLSNQRFLQLKQVISAPVNHNEIVAGTLIFNKTDFHSIKLIMCFELGGVRYEHQHFIFPTQLWSFAFV
jgi:hypothetical protein